MEIWKKWRETGTNKGNIIFVVADESGRTSENSEENIYCVTKELVTSSWYSVEIVINTLYLFQRAVELAGQDRDGDLFWLVSGYCLPIIGSDKLTPFWQARKCEDSTFTEGSQWMCLSRDNVDKICTLTEGEILSIKQEVDASLPSGDRGPPPDEYIFQSLLPNSINVSLGLAAPHWIELNNCADVHYCLLEKDGNIKYPELTPLSRFGKWIKNSNKVLLTGAIRSRTERILAVMGTLGFAIKYAVGQQSAEIGNRPCTFRKVHNSYEISEDDLSVLEQCWNDNTESWDEFYNLTNKVALSMYRMPIEYETFTPETDMIDILIERFCLWSAEHVPEKSRIRGRDVSGEYGHLLDYFKTFERPLSELPDLVYLADDGASDRWHELFEKNVKLFLDNLENRTNNPVLRLKEYFSLGVSRVSR